MEQVRIQKLISQSGYCSRREAERLIEQGRVKVNNQVALIGQKASKNDLITINNKQISFDDSKEKIYLLLNKPKGVISTVKDPQKRKTIIDLIDTEERLVPVGRLDYNTTGLMVLTNDLELVNKLTHPKYEIKRVYRVRIDSPLTLQEFKKINQAVLVNNKASNQIVDQVDEKSYLVELHQGSYHHIKELFKNFGKKVINLKRTSYANLNVEKIPEGCYRKLTLKEVKDLKNIVRKQEEKLCLEKK